MTLTNLFQPEHFRRLDEGDDAEFYEVPRLVVHIDDAAIAAARALYAEALPERGRLLDLMSSWRSHLPEWKARGEVVGLGMNAEEMARNPQVDRFAVHDLNRTPDLPFENGHFDAAVCTVSVQYLTSPVAVFREVGRTLQPGAPFVVTFSNRCFPTKAVALWRAGTDRQHLDLVSAYFALAGGWRDITAADYSAGPDVDPLFAVWGFKEGE